MIDCKTNKNITMQWKIKAKGIDKIFKEQIYLSAYNVTNESWDKILQNEMYVGIKRVNHDYNLLGFSEIMQTWAQLALCEQCKHDNIYFERTLFVCSKCFCLLQQAFDLQVSEIKMIRFDPPNDNINVHQEYIDAGFIHDSSQVTRWVYKLNLDKQEDIDNE